MPCWMLHNHSSRTCINDWMITIVQILSRIAIYFAVVWQLWNVSCDNIVFQKTLPLLWGGPFVLLYCASNIPPGLFTIAVKQLLNSTIRYLQNRIIPIKMVWRESQWGSCDRHQISLLNIPESDRFPDKRRQKQLHLGGHRVMIYILYRISLCYVRSNERTPACLLFTVPCDMHLFSTPVQSASL